MVLGDRLFDRVLGDWLIERVRRETVGVTSVAGSLVDLNMRRHLDRVATSLAAHPSSGFLEVGPGPGSLLSSFVSPSAAIFPAASSASSALVASEGS